MVKAKDLASQADSFSLPARSSRSDWIRFLTAPRQIVSQVVLVLLASSLITVIFWQVLPDRFRANEQSDYFAAYEPLARNILAGNGLSFPGESLWTVYPPGYPILLAGIFGLSHQLGVQEETSLSAFALICMASISVFIFLLSRMLWGTLAGLLSSLIWMTYPFALWLTKQPNSELPFMVVFYGGLCLFWFALFRRLPPRAYLLCGLVFGFAMMIRPIAIGMGLVLSAILWSTGRALTRRVRLVTIAMLLAGTLMAVLPWEAWVYFKTGNVILLSTNGVKSVRDGLTFAVETKGYRAGNSLPVDVVEVMNDIKAHENEITSFADFIPVISREVRSHPAGLMKLGLIKFARSWYGTDSQRMELPILGIQLIYLSLFAWGAWTAWKSGGTKRAFLIGSLLIVADFWGMTFLALSILRYMVPAVGFLFVLVAGCCPLKMRLESQLPAEQAP
jgi:4-amino-4-deoxy-L-arabinose transferase-like glycosyltransferase